MILPLLAAAAAVVTGCAGRDAEGRPEFAGSIAVLDFDDRAGRLDLAARLSDHFAARLAIGAAVVLDRSQVEALLREAGIPAADASSVSGRRLLREALGCDAVVTGLLADFEPGSFWEKPSVALSVRLIDLSDGKTICRTGGIVPGPGERPPTRDGERLALAFAATLADRVSDRLGGGWDTTCR